MITPPAIDISQLKKLLNQQYGLDILKITFLPKGETSWGYVIETRDNRYFLKMYKNQIPFIRDATQLTHRLFSSGIKQIVYAIPAKNDNTVIEMNNYQLALFNFVEGKEIYQQKLTDKELEDLGKIIGKIHSKTSIAREYPKRETFISKDKEVFLNTWNRIKTHVGQENTFQEQLIDLLHPRKEILMKEFLQLEKLGDTLRAKNLPFVICHSDPTPGNILIGKNGKIFLIDWDTPICAPKERDLFFFQERSESFMRGYNSLMGGVAMDKDALEFYRLEWNIQEIADIGNSILFQNNTTEQSAHDLKKLVEFLHTSSIGEVR